MILCSSDYSQNVYHILALASLVGVGTYYAWTVRKGCKKDSLVNREIMKDSDKVAHAFNAEELGDKEVFCRCWRSKKFPYCDGAHNNHNKETGDNVGPLIIKKSA